ncbi:MAG: DUF424 domain-containing protein [Thermoprotei archaeon]|nr:MAG: DUF424 domain-containing protein [Thermoprotei archaeon]
MSVAECYVKVHKSGNDIILAVCDRELLGKKISDGKLKIKVSEGFYGGKVIRVDELLEYIFSATIINVIGINSVNFISRHFPQVKDAVIWIGDIPHVQIITA